MSAGSPGSENPAYPGVEAGLRGEQSLVVEERNLAPHLGPAASFSTPSMIALMERACNVAVQPHLPPDHSTVGYEVHVRHLAPTPPGQRVTATAELLEVDGRKLLFRVEAHDERQRIGEGTHRRAIVDLKRHREKAGG